MQAFFSFSSQNWPAMKSKLMKIKLIPQKACPILATLYWVVEIIFGEFMKNTLATDES